jgi:hypothetical protein
VRSVHCGSEIAEFLFCTFSEDQGSSTSIRQFWEAHTLIVVIENAKLIGMGVFRTWYWKESPSICAINPKTSETLEDEDDGEFPF